MNIAKRTKGMLLLKKQLMNNDFSSFAGLEYSQFTGRYYAPKVEPACFKEPYNLLPVVASGAGQSFAIANLPDYPMSCDALMDNNGVYIVPTLDFDFTPGATLLSVSAYLQAGNLLELLASPNPNSSARAREYYYFVTDNGANQRIVGLPIFEDYTGTANFNVTQNGVLLTPVTDFSYITNVLTIFAYLQTDDIVGILPAAMLSVPTASVPSFTIAVTNSGAGQTFKNANFLRYTRSSDAIVTLNGLNLQPDVSPNAYDFSIATQTLTINPYVEQGSSITVLCNTQSC